MFSCADAPSFKHPFTCICAGPTKAGKSTLCKRIIEHLDCLVDPVPHKILWCYSEYQSGYEELLKNPRVQLIEGMPDMNELKSTASVPKLLVLDDMMQCMDKKKNGLVDLFTRGAHHWNCSCLHIVQNLF